MKQLVLVLATCAACSPAMRDPGSGVDASGGGSDGGSGSGSGIDAPPGPDASRVYAQSAGTLYRVDTGTFAETQIGAFTGISGDVTDIAVDKNGAMVAITNSTLYAVDPATAKGTQIKKLGSTVTDFTGLGYVPDPSNTSSDLLVTANAGGDVYSIDPATGNGTKIGNYGKLSGNQIGSSGDIFGVRGFGIYATVTVAGKTNDYLAEIDPQTWTATVRPSDTGFQNIYGLGFWAGDIYGFDDAGDVIKIDKTTGMGAKMDNNTIVWWGAGVTTNAPIIQ